MLNEKSRVKGDFQARFCERLGLKCPCLLDVCHEWEDNETMKNFENSFRKLLKSKIENMFFKFLDQKENNLLLFTFDSKVMSRIQNYNFTRLKKTENGKR